MKIQPVNIGKNVFCGPAVISTITGISTDDAEKRIQQVLGNNKPVRGVWLADLCETFKRLHYKCTYYTHLERVGSLFYILSVLPDGVYVLIVPGHYICIEVEGPRRYICDNHTKKPINAAVSARGMAVVERVVRVEKE